MVDKGKHFEGQTEKRLCADNEPDIWSDFVSVWYGGIYTHGYFIKETVVGSMKVKSVSIFG